MAIASTSDQDDKTAGASSQSSKDKDNIANDMISHPCSVCYDDSTGDANALIKCTGCKIAVHQACYGIAIVPPGNWYCKKCKSGDDPGTIKCELCPSTAGAFKKTENGRWAHVVCALYIPEVRFGNNNTMEPIEIKHVEPTRFGKTCSLCTKSGAEKLTATYGAVITCHRAGCEERFHVTCAQYAGLLREEDNLASKAVLYCGYCENHFRNSKTSDKKSISAHDAQSLLMKDPKADSSQGGERRTNAKEQDKITSIKYPAPANLPSKENIEDNLKQSSHTGINDFNNDSSNATVKTTPLNSSSDSDKTQNSSPSIASRSTLSSDATKKKNNRTQRSPDTCLTNNPTSALTSQASNQIKDVNKKSVHDTHNGAGGNNNIDAAKNMMASSSNRSTKKKSSSNTGKMTSSQPMGINSPVSTNLGALKMSSPNLSNSSNSSSTSPSTSSTTTTSCSTTSATSNSSPNLQSPSISLISPNIIPKTPSSRPEVRATDSGESSQSNRTNPTITGPDANTNMHDKQNTPEGISPVNIQTRINLDNLSPFGKNPITNQSLLSTTAPNMPSTSIVGSASVSGSGSMHITPLPRYAGVDALAQAHGSTSSNNNQPGNAGHANQPSLLMQIDDIGKPKDTTTTKPSPASAKAAPKPRPPPKNPRKKATDALVSPSKSEPKPKASSSKSKKAAQVVADADPTTDPPKAAAPKRSRAKASVPKPAPAGQPANLDAPTKSSPTKRKSRASSNDQNTAPAKSTVDALASNIPPSDATPTASPPKRQRKKKSDTQTPSNSMTNTNMTNPSYLPPTNVPVSSALLGGPLMISTPSMTGRTSAALPGLESADVSNRYFSPMISPYSVGHDPLHTASLSRSSLSRLISSTVPDGGSVLTDDPSKAFEELRDNTWSHLSKCVLEQAQQFDLPTLIGTLYTLRSENDKLTNRVRELSMKRDQLIAVNARLDLPGPMLTHHLNNTSPNFSQMVAGLASSKSLPPASPGSAMNKSLNPVAGPYNHAPTGPVGSMGFLDRASPLMSQPHPSLGSFRSSSISTPSPPVSNHMAHSASSRAGLVTAVNQPPYLPGMFPPLNPLSQISNSTQGPTPYYPRQ